MLTIALAFAVSLAVFLLTALYYFRIGLKKTIFFSLCAIRALIVMALCAIIFQPTFKISTIAPEDQGAIVVLDVSKSMRLFNADSSLSRFLATLKNIPSGKPHGSVPVRIVCFGDSTRLLSQGSPISFSDEHSYFPNRLGQDLESHGRVLIISDGNWSNPSLPRGLLQDKTCYYIKLPSFSPRPFLHTEFISTQQQVVQDSVSIVRLLIQGFKKTDGALDIAAMLSGRRVARASRKVNAGYFSDTVSVSLPSSRPGRSLCTVVAVDSSDSLSSLLYLVRNAVPRNFKASMCASRPTLDKRFIALALSKDQTWKFGDAGFDVLFILSWDSAAREALSKLKPTGIAVFIGCAPGADRVVVPDTFSLISFLPDDSLTQRLELQKMPPPPEIVSDTRPFSSPMHPILGCIARKATPFDTIPFLSYCAYGKHSALFCAARNVWTMEFLPLSVDKENETFSFLEYIVSVAKKQLLRNLNRNFFMYPAASEVYDRDSIAFCIVAPSEMTSAEPQSGTIHFTLEHNNNNVLDTTFFLALNEASGNQMICLRPFPAGTYAYKASLFLKEARFSYSDTLFVQENNLEMSVRGQNTLILNDLAIPIEMNDFEGLRTALASDIGQRNRATITRTIQIKHSWGLLAFLFVLFGMEWLIRRKIGLDL